jgi:copper chaperone CopZ
MRLILVVGMAVWLGGCGTWEIEPIPPEERGPRVSVPGEGTPPPPPPPTNPPGGDAPAGLIVVTVQKVDCSVCAALLERRLRTVAGVSSVTVDQKTGRAVVRGSGVSREALRREAEAGGFVVRGVEGVEGG